MGLKQRALEATKELRKQFEVDAHLSPKAKDAKELLDNAGSKYRDTKLVRELVSILLGEEIDERKLPSDFKGVKGSLLRCTETDATNVHETTVNRLVIDEGGPNISWVISEYDRIIGMKRGMCYWRPATDKEIEEYFG